MKETPPWYVVTGGPCSGKTTLLEELERRGYRVEYEAARLYIEEELDKGHTLAEIRADEKAFQEKVLTRKMTVEQALPRNEIVFLDRGMPDTEAYLESIGIVGHAATQQACAQARYRTIFLLDMLPYTSDHARTEDEAGAQRLHALLEETYRRRGYEPVSVPALPVSERAGYLIDHIETHHA